MSCEDHADVLRQAEALGLECLRVSMHSATNQRMGELLISKRPLPHEPPTTEKAASAHLELAAE